METRDKGLNASQNCYIPGLTSTYSNLRALVEAPLSKWNFNKIEHSFAAPESLSASLRKNFAGKLVIRPQIACVYLENV